LIVGVIASDDYNGTPDSGWTQSAEMEQQFFHGAYLWWRISTGETNPTAYTIGSATNSAWQLLEFSGIDATPYDTSQGKGANDTGAYTTDTITPSTGQRLLVAMGGLSSGANDLSGYTATWSDSFTVVDHVGNATGSTKDWASTAYRVVTGDGTTGFTTTITPSGSGDSRTVLIISFKEAAGGSVVKPAMHLQRLMRA
jgi:hypothetical protein